MLSRGLSTFRGRTHLPLGRGPFTVGSVDLETSQGLLVRLFYPHKHHEDVDDKISYIQDQANRWPKWLPSLDYATGYVSLQFGRQVPSFVGQIFAWLACDPYNPVVQGGSVVSASASASASALPVVVFSPGNKANRAAYTILCSDLASQGFVVAAVEHRDGSSTLARPEDAEKLAWLGQLGNSDKEDRAIRNRQVTIRADECLQALELLRKLHRADDLEGVNKSGPAPLQDDFSLSGLRGRLDLSRAVLAGHSFGGGTVVKVLNSKEHLTKRLFQLGVCFDAWMYPISEEVDELKLTGSETPLLFVGFEKFGYRANKVNMQKFERPLQEMTGLPALSGDSAAGARGSNVLTIRQAIHYVAADIPTVLYGSYVSYVLPLLGWPQRDDDSVLTPEQGLSVCLDLFMSFFRAAIAYQASPSSAEASAAGRDFARCLLDNEAYLLWGALFNEAASEKVEENSS